MKGSTGKICEEPFCRNKKKRKGKYLHKKCAKHIMQEYRKKHPARNYYQHLKWSAKKRGIIFTLTFEHLDEVLKATPNFFKKTGLLGKSLTVDRKETHLGYADGNIQVITRTKNSEKYWAEDRHYKFTGPLTTEQNTDDLPF